MFHHPLLVQSSIHGHVSIKVPMTRVARVTYIHTSVTVSQCHCRTHCQHFTVTTSQAGPLPWAPLISGLLTQSLRIFIVISIDFCTGELDTPHPK